MSDIDDINDDDERFLSFFNVTVCHLSKIIVIISFNTPNYNLFSNQKSDILFSYMLKKMLMLAVCIIDTWRYTQREESQIVSYSKVFITDQAKLVHFVPRRESRRRKTVNTRLR